MLLTRRESLALYVVAAVLGVGAGLMVIDLMNMLARWIAG